MTQTIRAIETQYKGYRFRSRLEARWAVFFDSMGIEWEYEPQGYEHEICEGEIVRYLPDFWLPKLGLWVEVKGNMTVDEARKLALFLDWDCPLPMFSNSNDRIRSSVACSGSMLILGNIPEPGPNIYLHKLISHSKGLRGDSVMFLRAREHVGGWNFVRFDGSSRNWYFIASGIYAKSGKPLALDSQTATDGDLLEMFSPDTEVLKSHLSVHEVTNAFTSARSARFEHGENGVPK